MVRARWVGLMLGFMFMALAWPAIPYWLSQIIPGGQWLDVRSVHVDSVEVGDPITMAIDRVVRSEFTGSRIVTVRRRHGSGFSAHCDGGRHNVDYVIGEPVPPNLTLERWLNAPCAMPPGEYIVVTHWVINLGKLLHADVSITSNNFTVYAPGQMPATKAEVTP